MEIFAARLTRFGQCSSGSSRGGLTRFLYELESNFVWEFETN